MEYVKITKEEVIDVVKNKSFLKVINEAFKAFEEEEILVSYIYVTQEILDLIVEGIDKTIFDAMVTRGKEGEIKYLWTAEIVVDNNLSNMYISPKKILSVKDGDDEIIFLAATEKNLLDCDLINDDMKVKDVYSEELYDSFIKKIIDRESFNCRKTYIVDWSRSKNRINQREKDREELSKDYRELTSEELHAVAIDNGYSEEESLKIVETSKFNKVFIGKKR